MPLNKSVKIDVHPYHGTKTSKRMIVSETDLTSAIAACNWDWHEIEDDPSTDVDEFEAAKATYALVFSVYDALCTKYDGNPGKIKGVKTLFNSLVPKKHKLP
jgi:hypothetical protein